MSVRRHVFGSLNDGEHARVVHKYDISNESGSLKVSVTEYGATLLSVQTWDRHGELEQITLNYYDDLNALASQDGKPYLGCIAGRFANRIAKGRFSLDGEEYQLAVNNGINHLHGGVKGFDTKVWESDIIDEASTGRIGVRFTLLSPDLDEGYPGAVQVVVEYEVKGEDLLVHIYATTTKATVLNLTNHAYWNLSGDGKRTIHDHLLHLACHHYLPVDATQIPIGEVAVVNGNSDPEENLFDFCTENVPKRLGERLHRIDGGGQPGLDHCFVVDGYQSAIAAGEEKPLLDVATLIDPLSGRVMVVRSTQPGVQVYTANWLPPYPATKTTEDAASSEGDGHGGEADLATRRARLFQQHNAICLETQHFPDSPNQPQFPSTVVRPTVSSSETPRTPTATDHDYHELTVFQFRVLTPSASSSQDSHDEPAHT